MLVLYIQPGVKSTRTIINNEKVLSSHKENKRESYCKARASENQFCFVFVFFTAFRNNKMTYFIDVESV